MEVKRIIPCLDFENGRVVKGIQFKNLIDMGDPIELARRYYNDGADELFFLDINATGTGRIAFLELISKIAKEINIPICVGGGIKSVQDMSDLMNAGAVKVSVCSSALERPQLLREMAEAYGKESVVISIDAARVNKTADNAATGPLYWHAFSSGGKNDTGMDAVCWAVDAVELGAGEILLNSIDADGTGKGYDLELIEAILGAVNVPVIASGGAGSLEQIADVLLGSHSFKGADAALVASFLHSGKTTISNIKDYLKQKGVLVR